ncbi:DDT domain-containing protein DDB_G0282237 isoform X2 [Carica papaya]|uniref:DDT domain-containing protein DDB_G0282237 isoform X2 n=1 Tax=Carica papaya TaxID=3649 RepID=UPI000B8CA1E8|nr:DDT domain-containing protein DDB_G0282237 isoform X2 [Carica papaya]
MSLYTKFGSQKKFSATIKYLTRINLYRKRVWMCKSTAKTNLTYEEALVSEKCTAKKVEGLPKELVAPALRTIQFSMLSLKDLANTIASELQQHLFVGAELFGRKDGDLYPCKILNIAKEGTKEPRYEVGWFDKDKKISENSQVNAEDLVWKKFPFSRNVLKSFIRESTSRSIPWILHGKLAQKHGISTDPPEEIQSKFLFQDGQLVGKKKRKKNENVVEVIEESGKSKRKKVNSKLERSVADHTEKEDNEMKEEPIKYPIDDALVQPSPHDPILTDRPSPSRDFNVPMDCVGDLLMVWDFCSSFSRLLHLWPFSLEDFDNAICHKDSNLVLIVELHASLFGALMRDNSEYFLNVQRRTRKLKITLISWAEYLCDFLEVINIPELCSHIALIKRGHYGLLNPNVKLGILRELVNQVLQTDLFREKLGDHIEQRRALGATRRGEALEEGRKKRERKEKMMADADADAGADANGVMNGHGLEGTETNMDIVASDNHHIQNGTVAGERNAENSSQENGLLEKSENVHLENGEKKIDKKQIGKMEAENVKDSSGKEPMKHLIDDKKEASEKKSKEQRKEYFAREIEKRVIRTSPLGKDRDYTRYWWFQRDGRIFVESSDSRQWGYYSSKEELEALMGSLNCKGERECALKKQLAKFYDRICLGLQKRLKDLAYKIAAEEAVLRRSTRVRAPPRENPANAFLKYVNKWKEE